jgi:hypothetical protein
MHRMSKTTWYTLRQNMLLVLSRFRRTVWILQILGECRFVPLPGIGHQKSHAFLQSYVGSRVHIIGFESLVMYKFSA